MTYQFEDTAELSTRGLQHPNPLFDFLTTFVPRRLKTLFQYCEYLYYNSPQIFAALNKFAIYPVTEFVYETDNDVLKKNYETLFEDILNLKSMLIRTGIDRHVYGNSFTSIFFPFHRFLRCSVCNTLHNIQHVRYQFKIKGLQFRMTCPNCKNHAIAKVEDKKIKLASGINIIRWDPKQMDVETNPITGQSEYYYEIPHNIRERVQRGDTSLVSTMPMPFLETIAEKKIFKFAPRQIYHMKADAPAGIDNSWGFPPLTSTIKQFFYVAVLRKANEAISMEHIVPFRVLHPQQISGNADPVITISMANWVNETKMNLKAWRRDPLHLMFSPVAMGVTTLGGQGRALMVTGEIKEAEENIIASMGIPREFLYGGLSATGSGVTLRMLENQLLNYTTELIQLAQWVADRCGRYLDWGSIKVKLQPFKLVDDVQQKMAILNANAQTGGRLVSNTTMASLFDLDIDEQREMRLQEEVDEFKHQHEVERTLTKLQTDLAQQAEAAAQATGSQTPAGNQLQIIAQADATVQQLMSMDEGTRRSYLSSLQAEDYVMYSVVIQRLEEAQNQMRAQIKQQMQAQGGVM